MSPRAARRATIRQQTAVAYRRVSTDAERQELGFEGQRQAIEAWAAANDVTIVAWFDDEGSGGLALPERPGLLDALASVAALGATYLVASTLDRFSRDPLSAALAEDELASSKASLVFADGSGNGSDPTAELVRGIRLAVAKFERQMIAARVRAALAVKQRRGEVTGAPRFGHRVGADGVHVEPCPKEQAVIARAIELRTTHTMREVVTALASEGIVGRAGKPLTLCAIFNLITRSEAA